MVDIVVTLVDANPVSLELVGQSQSLTLVMTPEHELAIELMQFMKGDRGDPASISQDRPNALRLGSDQKMLVDDVMQTNCPTDFLNIYQLSK